MLTFIAEPHYVIYKKIPTKFRLITFYLDNSLKRTHLISTLQSSWSINENRLTPCHKGKFK